MTGVPDTKHESARRGQPVCPAPFDPCGRHVGGHGGPVAAGVWEIGSAGRNTGMTGQLAPMA